MAFRSIPGFRASVRLALGAAALGLAALAAPAPASAQETDTVSAQTDTLSEIRLTDGSVFHGRIVQADGERVVFVTVGGARVEVERARIRSIAPVRGTVRNGEVWPADHNRTRLFFAPTGRTLEKGQGYFGVYELFLPFVSYGVSDAVTLSGGLPVLPGDVGAFVYVAPKVRLVNAPGTTVSAGLLGAYATESGDFAGVLYGVGTLGDGENALTFGAGAPFADGDLFSAIFMLGGETRISRRLKLLSENYFAPDLEGAILTGGVRFIGDRLSADAGLALPTGDCGESPCVLPIVNFVYTFGGR